LCINLRGREAKIHAWGPASLSNMEAFSRYTRRVLLLCLAKRILRLQKSLRAVPRIVKLLPFPGQSGEEKKEIKYLRPSHLNVLYVRAKLGRWVAKLVALLLATAALWVRIQTSLKNTKWATYAKEWPTHSSKPKKKYCM
jgi:hypothetical protein